MTSTSTTPILKTLRHLAKYTAQPAVTVFMAYLPTTVAAGISAPDDGRRARLTDTPRPGHRGTFAAEPWTTCGGLVLVHCCDHVGSPDCL
ncbi:hypothetical protein [Streptomyces fructofermentans]|uniref:Uncharacterized protein n=1 Tax=Streptomyces fructofermentans TaxID=152141 RepID=A0A918U5U4_9ACTN|nr:hypothetical protein [Streptomyces fructofermentans]GGX95025.1 hypothetical protein GCM10010515_72190 [Streptomyces fructofermentans]